MPRLLTTVEHTVVLPNHGIALFPESCRLARNVSVSVASSRSSGPTAVKSSKPFPGSSCPRRTPGMSSFRGLKHWAKRIYQWARRFGLPPADNQPLLWTGRVASGYNFCSVATRASRAGHRTSFVMALSPSQLLLRKVQEAFPTPEDAKAALLVLERFTRYGGEGLQLAAVKASNGQLWKLRELVRVAKKDFRDVFFEANSPEEVRKIKERQRADPTWETDKGTSLI
jgi:hypothetical protein